jgi:hypothetical protein
MNKFGIIFCGFNNIETVDKALESFLDDDRFVIAVVSVPFSEYIDQEEYDDGTTDLLSTYYEAGKIKYFIDSPKYIKDHEARNLAVKELRRDKIDYLWIADADETPSREDLNRIIEFVENDKDSFWWSLSYKNYVFDKKTYLKEPFVPPRIFKTKKDGFTLPSFYWDNCVSYYDERGNTVNYLSLPNKDISKEVAWIPHYTWPNNEIGRRKVLYQQQHHNGGACSFAWSEEKGLHFNEEWFRLNGKEIPEVINT